MNKTLLAAICAALALAAGCGGGPATAPNSAAANAPKTTANASPASSSPMTMPTPDPAKAKLYDGRGKVTKINLELVSVELDHEEIKGLMPKMIMEFYVERKSELEALKVGDSVEFVLEENQGQERIKSIRKVP